MKNLLHAYGFLLVTLIGAWSSVCCAFDAPPPPEKLADGPIAKLQPWVGNWEINAEWTGGSKLWARNEYKVGLGGKFLIANTYVKDDDGKLYHRYKTIFTYSDKEKKYVSHGFTADGTVQVVENEVTEIEGKPVITSSWEKDGTEVKQTVTMADADGYVWKVWTRPVDQEEWKQAMTGTWKRVE